MKEVHFLNKWECPFSFRTIICLINFAFTYVIKRFFSFLRIFVVFKSSTSIRCLRVRKKAIWPGSLFKKTCRRRRPFQHPRKKKAFACYSKAERRVLMMRARAIKARMCSISKIFFPLAITMVFAIER